MIDLGAIIRIMGACFIIISRTVDCDWRRGLGQGQYFSSEMTTGSEWQLNDKGEGVLFSAIDNKQRGKCQGFLRVFKKNFKFTAKSVVC